MSRVVLITTGGTIATSADADGVARQTQSGEALAAAMTTTPTAAQGADRSLEVRDLLRRDSSELTPADWDTIGAAVHAAAAGGAGAVVITHGTDTLEETAFWLELTHTAAVPVVLTGAMHSADSPDADGPANLAGAVALAGTPGASGVLVTLAGTVWRPWGLTKTGAGFTGPAPGAGPVGCLGAFAGVSAAGAPRVDVVAVYAGSDAVALDACVAAGARGLVLEALGSGNAGSAVVAGVARCAAAGVVVVVSSRVPGARVSARYGPGRALADAGAVAASRLRPAQARVLLMAALAAGSDAAGVAATFASWG